MPDRRDVIVIGGGIVGLATAHQLLKARPGLSVTLLEKESGVGEHQTGHNSGVIHAGIYYQPGSLKADFCRRGAAATTAFARDHGIPVATPGKLIVATEESELPRLSALAERAGVNGIEAVPVGAPELREREPHIVGLAGLSLPETGIIDYAVVARTLADGLRDRGVDLQLGTAALSIHESSAEVVVETTRGTSRARTLVACAGLHSDRLARAAGLETDLRIVPFRGEYFELAPERSDLVRHLIYPVPDPALPFLGVHLSPTIDGRITVGPNAVLGLSREGYPKGSMSARDVKDLATWPGLWKVARAQWRTGLVEMRNSLDTRGYLRLCQRYCPSLTRADLRPHVAGIRAQAVRRDGTLVHDFVLERTRRSIHVLNAPSPAATSALPIGDHLAHSLLPLL